MKACSKCKVEKELCFFYKSSRNKSGYHITPLSSVDNENDIIRLNHYTNLQPLCSKINRDIKKDKING